jgi:UDP-2-acetamido-2,6-beta-L-arabino-hexul-4-ose reductase
MKLAVTGSNGFLGWHVRCRAYARGVDCVPVDRDTMADLDDLVRALHGVDAVIHCAGANRGTDEEVTAGILGPAAQVREAVRRTGRSIRVVYANSTQSRADNPYGLAKRRAAELLRELPEVSDVVLPNLFGEHGRPHYNSFVATFCHQVARGEAPRVREDRQVDLLHVQDAAGALIEEAISTGHRDIDLAPAAHSIEVSRVLGMLRRFDATYRTGELPDIADRFSVRLFNTYRSYLFPDRYPIAMRPHTDARGTLVECLRTGTAGGQAFVSTTEPGATRGEHLHLRKFERFLVVGGEVEISLRRLFSDQVVRFRVSGKEPGAIDMPTMWAHKMLNVGDTPATTFFWTNELFSADDPDTFACPVETLAAVS